MKADGLASLVEAYVNRQDHLFRANARIIAKSAPDAVAKRINAALDRAEQQVVKLEGLPSGAARLLRPAAKLEALVLSAQVRLVLGELLEEVRRADELAAAGLAPATALLLCGPPGTGKTSTASALAAELELPLYAVKLAALVGSHLGESGKHVHAVLEAAGTTEGVWLLDEFDALGWARGGRDDVGEAHRIVNALLAALDSRSASATPRNLLVCASNRADALDAAVLRRFEHVVELGLPDEAQRAALFRAYLRCEWYPRGELAGEQGAAAVAASEGLSHAAIARACARHLKSRVLGRGLSLMGALGAEDAEAAPASRAGRRGV